MKRAYPNYDEEGRARARGLRQRMTPGEVRLWQRLRGRRLGVVFKRQRPIGPYVVDFYCAAHRLVVEVDGLSHQDRGEADLERQAYLEAQGLYLLRFAEHDAHRHTDAVVRQIQDVLDALAYPPPLGEVPAQRAEGVRQPTGADPQPSGGDPCSR